MLKGVPEGLLEELESSLNPGAEAFSSATWLLSPFSSPEWNIKFGKTERVIDWSVPFGNGLLTDASYAKTLNTFKAMVVSRGHPAVNGWRLFDEPAVKQLVYRQFRFVDYFLLRKDKFKLPKYGFNLVTSNDFDELLRTCANSPNDAEAVYQWSERLANWLDERVEASHDAVMAALQDENPFEDIQLPKESWTLTQDEERLVKWRAVLWLDGMYGYSNDDNYRYSPRTAALAKLIYRDTVFGQESKNIHEELCLFPFDSYRREYPGVDVRTIERDKPSRRYVKAWREAIVSMANLSSVGFDVPRDALDAVRQNAADTCEGNPQGRYRNPPFRQVLDGIGQGVEFLNEYGEALLESYVNISVAAKSEGKSPLALTNTYDVREFLTKRAIDFGVKTFCLKLTASGWNNRVNEARWTSEKFFADLRRGRGLLQNIQVLYGAYIHVIGPVTARRQDELICLPTIGCLDESRRNMRFGNAKSGGVGVRERESRPIPPVVEHIVSQVEWFQGMLVAAGVIPAIGALFSMPGNYGMRKAHVSPFNLALDVFCDYFSTPLSSEGKRYYLREHQFRRFLIITFFFGARTGSLQTLRWFVGHIDAAHLWHYLTNATSGEMRKEAAAYFLMDELRRPEEEEVIEMHEKVRRDLSDLVEAEFGTRKFSLIDADVLEEYLNLQMHNGLTVEPEFIAGTNGQQYKVVARLGDYR